MKFKTKIFIVIMFFGVFGVIQNSLAYDPPIGIPDPGFGIDQAMPTRPSVWTSEIPGYYFVDYHSASGQCSNSYSYGYPGKPRCTVPANIKKGSRIEINGVYDYGSGGVNPFVSASDSSRPNGNSWNANIDGPAWITCSDSASCFSGPKLVVYGSYLYFDSIKLNSTTLQISTPNSALDYDADHIMVRNSTFSGNGATQMNGLTMGGSINSAVENILVYKNTFSNFGDMNIQSDMDNSAVGIAEYSSYVWVLENDISNISNTALFAGAQYGNLPSLVHHVFFGKNRVYNVNVGAISEKNIQDCVISQNDISDVHDSSWSEGKCFGAQYGPERVWWLHNSCHHARYGLKIGSSTGGNSPAQYVIGNVFYDIGWKYRCTYSGCQTAAYPGNAYAEAAVTTWGGGDTYIINNTIYDASSGILSPSNGNYYIENNIIANLNDPAGYLLWLDSPIGTINIDNNDLYQPDSWKVRWGSSVYSSAADFYNAKGQCQDCLSSDPEFVNTTNYADLSLRSTSSAINKGLSDTALASDAYAIFQTLYPVAGSIRMDIAGISRPQGAGWDIGAYEYSGSSSDTNPPSAPSGLSVQ